jgi:hypothetical protein
MKIKQVLDFINARRLRRLLRGLYHRKGRGRKPYNPLSMLKAQILKHLPRIPSDRRLALRLKDDRKTARACGFRKQTPSHSLRLKACGSKVPLTMKTFNNETAQHHQQNAQNGEFLNRHARMRVSLDPYS